MKLLLNSAQCLNCKDTLISKDRHDWVSCTCYNQANENIQNYQGNKFLKNSTSYTKRYLNFCSKNIAGIFIDGGTEYVRHGGKLCHFKDLSKYKKEKKDINVKSKRRTKK